MYELGADSGRNYSMNVPLKEGMDDQGEHRRRNFSQRRFTDRHTDVNPINQRLADLSGFLCRRSGGGWGPLL